MDMRMIKRLALSALAVAAFALPSEAQSYTHSRYYNERTGRLDYSYSRYGRGIGTGDTYYGFRIGPAFSTVKSDDPTLNGSDSQTGLTVGAVVGIPLSMIFHSISSPDCSIPRKVVRRISSARKAKRKR